MGGMIIGCVLGFILATIIAVIIIDSADNKANKPPKIIKLTNIQAAQKLQEIKPYYARYGATWVALDMAIKMLGEAEDEI